MAACRECGLHFERAPGTPRVCEGCLPAFKARLVREVTPQPVHRYPEAVLGDDRGVRRIKRAARSAAPLFDEQEVSYMGKTITPRDVAQALYAYVELLDPVEAWRQVMRDLEGIRPVLGKAMERAMKALELVEPVRPAPKPEPEMLPSEAAVAPPGGCVPRGRGREEEHARYALGRWEDLG